jgi:hypothetical protein
METLLFDQTNQSTILGSAAVTAKETVVTQKIVRGLVSSRLRLESSSASRDIMKDLQQYYHCNDIS